MMMKVSRNIHGFIPSKRCRFRTLLLSVLALIGIFLLCWSLHVSLPYLVDPSIPKNHVGKGGGGGGYVYPPKIFGHLHYAKTAGTEINGQLAAHYERVCGHKGSSHDSYQVQLRQQQQLVEEMAQNSTHRPKANQTSSSPIYYVSETHTASDSISKVYPTYNRGRVPEEIMWERGFEDCDWISLEFRWETWAAILPDYPIELHVPCRHPIQHLMSQCNHKGNVFNCDTDDLQKEVYGCLLGWIRFDKDLTRGGHHINLKCFNPIPIDPYLEYMGNFLQKRRFETKYVHRETNPSRNHTAECIWERKDLHDEIWRLLKRLDYYRFCADCMGSKNNLLRPNETDTKSPTPKESRKPPPPRKSPKPQDFINEHFIAAYKSGLLDISLQQNGTNNSVTTTQREPIEAYKKDLLRSRKDRSIIPPKNRLVRNSKNKNDVKNDDPLFSPFFKEENIPPVD